jgi:hypothetical protein
MAESVKKIHIELVEQSLNMQQKHHFLNVDMGSTSELQPQKVF